MRPPTGHYRKLLSATHPQVRIAFTHTPIYGCTKINSSDIQEVLKQSDDMYAEYYFNGLRDGSMVAIVENSYHDRVYKNNGELYFTS